MSSRPPLLAKAAKFQLDTEAVDNHDEDDEDDDDDFANVTSAGAAPLPPPRSTSSSSSGRRRGSNDEATGVIRECPICLSAWHSLGAHRICSLRCGHLFGRSCILRWVRQHGSCPNCLQTARPRDLRIVYASKIEVQDQSALQNIEALLDQEKRCHERTCHRLEALKIEFDLLQQRHERLLRLYNGEEKLGVVQAARENDESTVRCMERDIDVEVCRKRMKVHDRAAFHFFDGIDACDARILSYDSISQSMLISERRSSGQAFGVSRVSLRDTKHRTHIPLHSHPIRDMSFQSRDGGLVMTASFDKSLRLASMRSESCVLSVKLDEKVYSCAWGPALTDESWTNYMLCGLANGEMRIFDIRKADNAVHIIRAQHRQPIHALCTLPFDSPTIARATFGSSSLLSTTCSREEDWFTSLEESPLMSNVSSCSSLSFDSNKHVLLVGARQTTSSPVQSELWSVHPGLGARRLNAINDLRSQMYHSRATVFTCEQDDSTYIVGGEESSRDARIWSVVDADGRFAIKEFGSLNPHNSPILDVRFFNGLNILAALSQSCVMLNKYSSREKQELIENDDVFGILNLDYDTACGDITERSKDV